MLPKEKYLRGWLTHKKCYSEELIMEKIVFNFLSMIFLSIKGFKFSSCLERESLTDSLI